MELKVLQSETNAEPWYARTGLRFTCTQCGNCCTGAPGYVWISREEISRLAAHLQISEQEVVKRYCRRVGGKYSLREHRNERGEYDCIFLKEEMTTSSQNGQEIRFTRRTCTVYPVRPLQCRTWPFWSEIVQSPERWERAGKRCHGINHGDRVFTREQVEALRDARDWPENPPTSG